MAELKNKLLTRMTLTEHRNCYLKSQIPNFFSNVKKEWEFRLDEKAFFEFWIGPRSTKWSFENASQRWKMWKTHGFEHFSFNMAEKVDDSCRAASQPISLFYWCGWYGVFRFNSDLGSAIVSAWPTVREIWLRQSANRQTSAKKWCERQASASKQVVSIDRAIDQGIIFPVSIARYADLNKMIGYVFLLISPCSWSFTLIGRIRVIAIFTVRPVVGLVGCGVARSNIRWYVCPSNKFVAKLVPKQASVV